MLHSFICFAQPVRVCRVPYLWRTSLFCDSVSSTFSFPIILSWLHLFFFSVLPKERKEMITLPLMTSFSYPWSHGRLCRIINSKHSKWYNTVITFSIDIIEASAVFKLFHFTTIALYFHSYSLESNVTLVFPKQAGLLYYTKQARYFQIKWFFFGLWQPSISGCFS